MAASISATLFPNPHALVLSLRGGFFYAKNPLIAGGEQILNDFQHRVLRAVRPGSGFSDIAERLNCEARDVRRAIAALEQTDLVSQTQYFRAPEAPSGRRSLSLWIHTSNACNLACPYCYVNAVKQGPKMSTEALQAAKRSILASVELRGINTVTLKIAGGEPLVVFREWKDEVEALKRDLESRGIVVHLHLLTNGTIASDNVIDYVIRNGIGVGLSIDGIGKRHNQTRFFHGGKPSFDIVVKNLRRYRRAGVRPYITAVVTTKNLQDLVSLTRFCIEENLGFRFSLQKGGVLDTDAIASALEPCYSAVEKALPGYDRFLSHTLCDLSFSKPIVDTPCGVGRSHASVNVDGSMHTCQTEHNKKAIGNVFEEVDLLSAIGGSEVADSLARIDRTCKTCRYRYLCAGGCPTFKTSNKSPFCQTFLQFIPTILRLRGLSMLYMLRDEASRAQIDA